MSDEVKPVDATQVVDQKPVDDLQSKINAAVQDRLERERKSWVKELGTDDVASAKEAIKKFREMQDSQKTEAEKLKSQLDEKDKELAVIRTQAEVSEAKSNALAKGIDPDKLDKFIKIAQTEDGETVSEKIDKALASFPEFMKKSGLPNISAKTSDNNMNADEMFLAKMRKEMGIK